MLEHKILRKVLKILTQECSIGEFRLTLGFYGKVKFVFWASIWEEFMLSVENVWAKNDKYRK